MIERLAWVTTRGARGQDQDEPVARLALSEAGVSVEVVDWDDPAVDWSTFDRVVLRSAWDYTRRLSQFLTWLDHVDTVTDLVNPPATARWSMDKRYLAELSDAGVPITPTTFVPPGTEATFPSGSFVVKPAVGAGSREAASYRPSQREIATAHVARLHADEQVVLIQPFLPSITTEGEWPMVFFDGQFSHAANKRVTLPEARSIDGLFAQETNTSHVPTDEQLQVAYAALDLATKKFGTPTYARVDLVRDERGRSCVLELELNEPSLFLSHAGEEALRRLVAALTHEPAPPTKGIDP